MHNFHGTFYHSIDIKINIKQMEIILWLNIKKKKKKKKNETFLGTMNQFKYTLYKLIYKGEVKIKCYL